MKPAIVAGEPELHAWCATCQAPTRVRVPLHLGTTAEPVANVLEICPGCGTGHDRPRVEIAAAPRERPAGNVATRLARRLHAWRCRRHGLMPRACAYSDCQWPGLWRLAFEMAGEDGRWTYLFCSVRHKRAWARSNGLRLGEQIRGG